MRKLIEQLELNTMLQNAVIDDVEHVNKLLVVHMVSLPASDELIHFKLCFCNGGESIGCFVENEDPFDIQFSELPGMLSSIAMQEVFAAFILNYMHEELDVKPFMLAHNYFFRTREACFVAAGMLRVVG